MKQPEIMYESKGKAPNGEPFLTVKKARGYYEYSERPGKDSIAFILWDNDKKLFGLIYESKPPLDERLNEKSMLTTAFGGSIDMDGKSYKEICKIEVLEETGYDVSIERINSIGKTLVSTQMSQMLEGFLVDITGLEKTHKAEYEKITKEQELKDPEEFSKNKVVWMGSDALIKNSDWKSIFIVSKAIYYDIIQ